MLMFFFGRKKKNKVLKVRRFVREKAPREEKKYEDFY